MLLCVLWRDFGPAREKGRRPDSLEDGLRVCSHMALAQGRTHQRQRHVRVRDRPGSHPGQGQSICLAPLSSFCRSRGRSFSPARQAVDLARWAMLPRIGKESVEDLNARQMTAHGLCQCFSRELRMFCFKLTLNKTSKFA